MCLLGSCADEKSPGFSHRQKSGIWIPGNIPRITRALFTMPKYEVIANPYKLTIRTFFLDMSKVNIVMIPQKYSSAHTG